jgi:hypothetical protein
MQKNQPFDIPAINNRKEALMLHLGLDSANGRALDSVKEIKDSGLSDDESVIAKSASVFEHCNARYYVAHASSKMEGDVCVAFNSSHWTIRKVPLPASWPIKDPTQLPAEMRLEHGYPYLCNSFLPLWLEGLRVSHWLLDRHEENHGNEVYYQDNFGRDYIAAMPDPQFDTCGIVFDDVTDPAVAHLHRNEQPAWQAFKAAKESLKTGPRGAIALLGNQGRWYIGIHAGDGYINECRTMRSSGPKPEVREIQECLLSYEGFLARSHAKRERTILQNFARLRELNLQPGQTVRDVELLHNGKRSKITFKIESISASGYLSLGDGTLRGARARFTASIPACDICKDQVQLPVLKKKAVPVDLDTVELF